MPQKQQQSLTIVERALHDVLDGQSRWYEIMEQTGLPEKRCKALESIFDTLDEKLKSNG